MNHFFFKESHFKKIHIDDSKLYTCPNTDSLMGCVYILKYGIAQYERNIHINKDFMSSMKYECIDYIIANKSKVKLFNKKISFNSYVTMVSNNIHIDLDTFFMLCHLYDIDITYIHGPFFYSTVYTPTTVGDNVYIKVLCRNTPCNNSNVEYHLETRPYQSIEWNSLYQLTSITYPVPDINTISKEQLMYILSALGGVDGNMPSTITKKKLYDKVISLVKLI